MRKPTILFLLFIIVFTPDVTWATDLSGKFVVGAGGGLCYSMGSGFASYPNVDGRFGVRVSAEYFVLKPLSIGLALAYDSFEGEWRRSGYYSSWDEYYYTDWNWTNISIFGRFVLAPYNEVSPYFTAGVGVYIPRIEDKWYHHPDTIHSHASSGKGQSGFHFGFGIHYLPTRKMLVYLEVPLNFINTEGLVIEWLDMPLRMSQRHEIYDVSQVLNLFVGIAFLFGSGKEAGETKLMR